MASPQRTRELALLSMANLAKLASNGRRPGTQRTASRPDARRMAVGAAGGRRARRRDPAAGPRRAAAAAHPPARRAGPRGGAGREPHDRRRGIRRPARRGLPHEPPRGRKLDEPAGRPPRRARRERGAARVGRDRPQRRGDGRARGRAAPRAPEAALQPALAAATAELPRHLPGSGSDAVGLPALRAAIAARFCERGAPTAAEQVLVTAGAQHAFALLLRVLAGPGDRVLVDHPTYPNALDAVRAAGARPVPVALASDGWDLDMLEATLRQSAPRLAYVIADHHNPTGLTLDAGGRARAVELARATRTPLVVDETMAELTLEPDSAPPAPVAAHNTAAESRRA